MRDLSDAEIVRLQSLLDEQAAGASVAARRSAASDDGALDVSALDGYLCGMLLQPRPVGEAQWLSSMLEGGQERHKGPAASTPPELLALIRRRHAVLAEAIGARQWFDPWIFEHVLPPPGQGAGAAASSEQASALPWVAGFALAMEQFPELLRLDAEALAVPLALLYQHFDPEDLEGLEEEPALAAALQATEAPADMAQAAEDLVRAVLLLADVSRPRGAARDPGLLPGRRAGGLASPRTGPGHASPGPGPRWQNGRRERARRG